MRATTATVLTVAIGAANAQSLQCAQGVHIIAARGTGEKEGPGVSGELADRVIDRIRGSEVDGLDYPATLTDPDYLSSAKDGAEELREVVRQYAEDCPDTKIVVIGYSQGAQVATNTFCGGGGDGFGNEDALPENLVEDHVSAIILFGDPSHVANATYNRGTADNNGIFPRDDVDACEDLGDRIVSYCDTGDVYCDNGEEKDRDVHGEYIERYGDEVVDYIVKRYESDTGETVGGGSSTTSSGSMMSTASPTSSGTESGSTTATETSTATETATETSTETATETEGGSATTSGDEGSASETGDAGDAAAGLAVPAAAIVGLGSLAVLGLM